MSVIAVIKVPKVKVRKANAPPAQVMRDRRNRRPKDARRIECENLPIHKNKNQ
jgi:hypothetical protein